jgi:DNA (cytosine-5)-methyltransferase 1
MEFSEPPINYGEIRESPGEYRPLGRLTSKYWRETPPGRQFSTIHPEGKWNSMRKADIGQVLFTIMAKPKYFDPEQPRYLTAREVLLASTFPLDYNLSGLKADYIAGMSVPPVMIAQIASRIWEQWLCKIR